MVKQVDETSMSRLMEENCEVLSTTVDVMIHCHSHYFFHMVNLAGIKESKKREKSRGKGREMFQT